MPELPEVETVVRALAPRVTGRHIVSAEILHPRIVRHSKVDVPTAVAGARIAGVRRHGKFIVMPLDRGFLTLHLGMTGKLLFDVPPGTHTRAIFSLDDSTLLYNDSRMFGSIEWTETEGRTVSLGPDALNAELTPGVFKRRTSVKSALLNQSIYSGIGNIYADEALFRAGIRPGRRADRISAERLKRLMDVIRDLLAEAVGHRGSSVSDYVDTEGRRGGFQHLHRVYGREGLPCVVCGTPVRKTVVAQRGTHFCPKCQR